MRFNLPASTSRRTLKPSRKQPAKRWPATVSVPIQTPCHLARTVNSRRLKRPQSRLAVTSYCSSLSDAVALPLPDQTQQEQQNHAREALLILERANRLHSPIKAYHLRRARYLDQSGEVNAVVEEERARAQELRPVSALDYFLLGHESYQHGEWAKATAHFEDALILDPNHFWAQYFMAACCLKQEHLAGAMAHIDSCLSKRPDFVWTYMLRGAVHGEQGVAYLADASSSKFLAEVTACFGNPMSQPVGIFACCPPLGTVGQVSSSDARRAEKMLALINNEFEAAEADFRRAMEMNTAARKDRDPGITDYGLLVNRAAFRNRRGRLEQAKEDLERAIAIRKDCYQAYLNLADVFQKQGKLDDALRQYNEAVNRQPDLAVSYRARARLYLQRHDLENAWQDFGRALKREVDPLLQAEDLAELGRILHRQKKYTEAVKAYDAALKLRDDYPIVHRLRGEALLELKQFKEAEQAFSEFLRVDKSVADVYRARGLIRAKLKNHIGSMEDYTRALELEPDSAKMRTHRGWAYILRAEKLALEDFDSAIKLNPEYGDAYNGRGYALVKLGRYREAVQDADEAMRRGPEGFEIIYNAACIYAEAAAKAAANKAEDREVRGYREQAVALVSKALDRLPAAERKGTWRNAILPDPAMDPIRSTAAFAQWEKDFGTPP